MSNVIMISPAHVGDSKRGNNFNMHSRRAERLKSSDNVRYTNCISIHLLQTLPL